MGWRALSLGCLALFAVGCGAKTGLTIPDAAEAFDAGRDAGMDSGMCLPRPIELMRRGAQIMFVIDRSNSMGRTFDDRVPMGGEPRRWDLVAQALDAVLSDADPLLELGAKFYPRVVLDPQTPEEACSVDEGIDLAPARNNGPALLSFFGTTEPGGGTPTAMALAEARDFFSRRPSISVPRFVILATDGGPNCNPDTGVSRFECVCTGTPDFCNTPPPEGDEFGPYNCIDDVRTIGVITDIFGGLDIPVYVIGILDPTRPDLADVLDQMAIAGGRPREEIGERRFYDVGEPDDLRGAFETITDSISRCVFTMAPAPGTTDLVQVSIDGIAVARDTGRVEGWDFTAADRSELTLFGGACARVTSTGGEVTATIECVPEE